MSFFQLTKRERERGFYVTAETKWVSLMSQLRDGKITIKWGAKVPPPQKFNSGLFLSLASLLPPHMTRGIKFCTGILTYYFTRGWSQWSPSSYSDWRVGSSCKLNHPKSTGFTASSPWTQKKCSYSIHTRKSDNRRTAWIYGSFKRLLLQPAASSVRC